MSLYKKLYNIFIKDLKIEYAAVSDNIIKQNTIKQIIHEKSIKLKKKVKDIEKQKQDIKKQKQKREKIKKQQIEKDELDILKLLNTENNTEESDKTNEPNKKINNVNTNLMNRMVAEIDMVKSKNTENWFETPYET